MVSRQRLLIISGILILAGLYFSGILMNIILMINMVPSDCDHQYNIDGETKSVDVYYCSEIFIIDNIALGYASLHGDIIKFHSDRISKSLVMHELGHNLGYLHSGGNDIMNTNGFKRQHRNRKLTRPAVHIAEEFEGFKKINWSNKEDINYIKREIEKDNMKDTTKHIVKENMGKYKRENCIGIYYTKKPEWINTLPDYSDFYIQCGHLS